jgi:hypothetical protein
MSEEWVGALLAVFGHRFAGSVRVDGFVRTARPTATPNTDCTAAFEGRASSPKLLY